MFTANGWVADARTRARVAALLAGQRARHHISATGYDPSRAQGRASEWEQAAGRSFVVFCAGRGWGLGTGSVGHPSGSVCSTSWPTVPAFPEATTLCVPPKTQ